MRLGKIKTGSLTATPQTTTLSGTSIAVTADTHNINGGGGTLSGITGSHTNGQTVILYSSDNISYPVVTAGGSPGDNIIISGAVPLSKTSNVTLAYWNGFWRTVSSLGNQGAQGEFGEVGIQGSQGFTGDSGFQGVQGATGNGGTVGNQGTFGAQGVNGFAGVAGSQGATGAQGTQGAQGAAGQPGDAGNVGASGVQGFTGDAGNQGDNCS
jgi:hypothetical protein